MPIHLPPLSRRKFIASALSASAGLISCAESLAGQAALDPHRFALLADIHIWQQRDGTHNNVKPAENFERVRNEILSRRPCPAAVIIAGDCVFLEGQAADYHVLAELVRPARLAGVPLHLVLGNHDHRQRFEDAFPETRSNGQRRVPEKSVAVLESERANWFLLDSLDRTNVTPGRLGEAQLRWLARELDARSNKPALVVAHHNPDRDPKTSGLVDTAALFDVLVPRKQVKAYLFGHTHCWNVSAMDGIHLINLPTTAWLFDPKAPRGWVDAQLRPDGIALTLNALDPKHPSHGKCVELTWRG